MNQGIAMLLEGDVFGAAKLGISVFSFVKLHPSALGRFILLLIWKYLPYHFILASLKQGYNFREADTSKYDFNTGQTSSICSLPQEIFGAILLENNIEDLIAFSMVCRQFKKFSDHNEIWTGMYQKLYGRPSRAKNCKKAVILKRWQELNMPKGMRVIFLHRLI